MELGVNSKPIRAASEQVAVQIQHHIQRAGLGPGDVIGREEALAAEFGVSRAALREPLKRRASGSHMRATKCPANGTSAARTADVAISSSPSVSTGMTLKTFAATLAEIRR